MLAATLAAIALLPGVLTDTVDGLKAPVPVLLPDKLYSDVDETLHPSGKATRRGYSIALGAAPDCNGATVCFVADFSARKGGRPSGRGKATLARGRKGRYQPLSCGASCSPPSISWSERGVTYTIRAKTDRRGLVRMANQAIKRGPR